METKNKNLIERTATLINNYVIRTETHQGSDYIIVPVVMMVEGVHNGSGGPILYTVAELSQFTSAWNGIPVVVNHPQTEDGNFISANIPEVLNGSVAGRIHNTRMDGKKLKAEAWIDVSALSRLSAEALQHIKDQQPLDVSVGVLCEEEEVEGNFHNEHYRAIAHNLRPDHLALLPGETGACSWDDGCGIRNEKNKSNKSKTKLNKNDGLVKNNKMTIKQINSKLLKNGFAVSSLKNSTKVFIQNEMGFREISMNIQRKLDAFDTESKSYYLEEVFDDYLVYRVHNREDRSAKFYKRSYQVNNGQIVLQDDAVEVVKNVSFDSVSIPTTNKMIRTKKSKTNKKVMANKKASPCAVTEYIANTANTFTEGDREYLEALDEGVFDKMASGKVPVVVGNEDDKSKKKQLPEETTAEAVRSFFANQKTPEAFIDLMPGALKDQMKSGMQMYTNRRNKLIESIVANSEFSKEALEKWDNAALETMHSSVVKEEESDFSGLGEVALTNGEEPGEELNAMMRFDVVKNTKSVKEEK